MLHSIHDYKSLCWANRWVLAALVLGRDQPFIRRLIGVSTSPQVGSIYNIGVWAKVAATWLRVDVRRTLDSKGAACRKYQVTGRSLDNGGCIAEPHIVVDRCLVFLCILHCCMAIGRVQVAFADAPGGTPQGERRGRAPVAARGAHGVKLGASAPTRGEDATALFLACGPIIGLCPGGR